MPARAGKREMNDRARSRPLLASVAALLLGPAAMLAACDNSTKPSPSPEAIATAKSDSREITIPAPISTTPEADDSSATPIVLRGRVFGAGTTAVILAPMRFDDETAWFPFATKLAATAQFTVVTFDFRGVSDSTGDKESDRADTDLAAVYAYARDTLGLSRIFLVGASTGGTASLVVGARMPVAGVVSISSPGQFLVLDALDAVPAISAPKLFITSKDDVPAQRSEQQFWAAANEPKFEEIYEGKAVGTDLVQGPHGDAVQQRILTFLTSQ